MPEFLGMSRVQVDFIVRTVQRESDGAFGMAAIEIIDKESLYLLGHSLCSVPVGALFN
jgi:hypothetical protein